MAWLFQPLLMLLARSTDSQLAPQVEFLHAQIVLSVGQDRSPNPCVLHAAAARRRDDILRANAVDISARPT
jgi:hypothetical protein